MQSEIILPALKRSEVVYLYHKLVGVPVDESPQAYIDAVNSQALNAEQSQYAKAAFLARFVVPPVSFSSLLNDYEISDWFNERTLHDAGEWSHFLAGPARQADWGYYCFFEPAPRGEKRAAQGPYVYIILSRWVPKEMLLHQIKQSKLDSDITILVLVVER